MSVLAINAGSSSIRFAHFAGGEPPVIAQLIARVLADRPTGDTS